MSKYTKKVSGLTYEPTGECPALSELIDMTKTKELAAEIVADSTIPDDVKMFLIEAAHRHAVFNYSKIAEYYCHAPANIQRLMEKSALVVIDLDDAMKWGFVKYSKKLEELRGDQNGAEKDDGVLVLEGKKSSNDAEEMSGE